ncbi:MAG: FAD-binding oxidoreductase [Chloroflexi bacterium]|nr:FAD-binding oxidoreductase [Chloroflexota bacterium]
MAKLPESVKYVIIGAGVHGMSTAWHLAMELEARGHGSGKDIAILDKGHVGAGATGVACGCIRNFYMVEPLHAILRHSVDVWAHDPISFGFQQVGYVSCGEANQVPDFERMHKSQNSVGYLSDLYVGKDARKFLKSIWPDFKTEGIDVALMERLSGYTGVRQTIDGFTDKCASYGVPIFTGVEVTGYDIRAGQVNAVITNEGAIRCDAVIWCLGPWTPEHWKMLGKPMTLDCRYPDGGVETKDMWTYWRLREGEVYYDEPYLNPEGKKLPVLHIEKMNTPVVDEETGKKLGDYLYVYFKNANERMDRPGMQGGGVPVKVGVEASVDPYGHANEEYQAEPEFADYFCAAMGQTMSRFEGCRPNFRERRNGGIGAFTPDNVPIFDWVLPNLYMIEDSGHGFKMVGVGKLVARLLEGDDVEELKPFALSRFAEGRTFGKSNSHSPWV